MSFNIVSLVTHETSYECPKCKENNAAYEWNIATADEVGSDIMPIHLADDGDYCYTCPTCWEVSNIAEITYLLEG